MKNLALLRWPVTLFLPVILYLCSPVDVSPKFPLFVGMTSMAVLAWAFNVFPAIGVAALRHLVAQATRELPGFDIEICETHHNQKVDAPSGTAKMLLDEVIAAEPESDYYAQYGREGICGKRNPKEVGMHSLRGGTVAGVHTVSFFGTDEEVSLTHRATSRQIFVNGALAAAQKLAKREPGFYTFDQVMFE